MTYEASIIQFSQLHGNQRQITARRRFGARRTVIKFVGFIRGLRSLSYEGERNAPESFICRYPPTLTDYLLLTIDNIDSCGETFEIGCRCVVKQLNAHQVVDCVIV